MGSLDHGHGTILHWSIAILFGFFLTMLLGQSFAGPINWANPIASIFLNPLLGLILVIAILGWYYLLKHA